jgi:hypothetical protein
VRHASQPRARQRPRVVVRHRAWIAFCKKNDAVPLAVCVRFDIEKGCRHGEE